MSHDPNTPPYAAGWYPDNSNPGTQRYHDGTMWTEHTSPLAATAPAPITATVTPPGTAAAPSLIEPASKKKRKWPWVVGAAVAALILIPAIATAAGAGGSADKKPATVVAETIEQNDEEATETTVPDVAGITAKEAAALLENAGLKVNFQTASGVVLDRDNWTVTGTTPTAGASLKTGDTVVVQVVKTKDLKAAGAPAEPAEPATPAAPVYSLAQQNSIRQAQSYLKYTGFSRPGLIGQLEYEGFSTDEATFGADNAGADWNAEAAESAADYLAYTSFSRDGLYEQLAYEGFSDAEILFGLAAVGY